MQYAHLVRVPHSWRRQLTLKGRRITAGQLIAQMKSNRWDADRAASEFDLSREAVLEAMDYAERFRSLISEEAAEETRRADLALTHRPVMT